MEKIITFIKKEIVLIVSLVLALFSMIFVPIDKEYVAYFDFRTLAILFCLMIVMAGLQKQNVFKQLGEVLIDRANTVRQIGFILIGLCFFLSMFITNDVALITFVPFTIVVLTLAKFEDMLIPVIVLETMAANLGSMMMPMGNPQNLYLYSITDLTLGQFVLLMLPYGSLSLICIVLLAFKFIKNDKVHLELRTDFSRGTKEILLLVMYVILFLVSIAVVSRKIDYRIGFTIVLAVILLFDQKIITEVDYSLLFTFSFLFVFIGNLKRIPAISEFLAHIVAGHEVGVGVLASQVISNVPAAILLSGFCSNVNALIIGVNLGGLGTLIASMASLISFKFYQNVFGADKRKYFRCFTVWGIAVLALLMVEYFIIRIGFYN